MMGLLNTVVGNISAVEKKKYITLYGINGFSLTNEITNYWKTSRITNNVFENIGRMSISFHKFFLLDVIYTLNTLSNQSNLSISRRSLIKAIDVLTELTDLRSVYTNSKVASITDITKLNDFNIKPLTWQKDYIDIFSDRIQRYKLKGHLLAADPGAGKTIAALILMRCLGVDTIFIISPKNAVNRVWQSTIDSVYRKTPSYWYSTSNETLQKNKEIYICHYEYIKSFLDFIKDQTDTRFGKIGIIVDECHNFNDETSNRTQLLVELSQYSTYNLWMSGTPIKAMGRETIPLLQCIDPIFDKEARSRYISVFGKASDRALDILQNRIGTLSHRVVKGKVIDKSNLYRYQAKVKLKNGKDYTIPVIREKMRKYVEERTHFYKKNMDEYIAQYEDGINYYHDTIKNDITELAIFQSYKEKIAKIRKGFDPFTMKDDSLFCNKYENTKIIPKLPSEMKKYFKKAKSVYKYVELTIMGECLGVILGKTRSDCNRDIALNLKELEFIPIDNAPILPKMGIEELITNAKKKTILFSSFVDVVETMHTHLSERGYKPLVVYGQTNKNLNGIISQFQDSDIANPLIATFQSLSTAVPLTMANTVVMLNMPFREHEYIQAYSRAFRKGQDEDVYVIDILLDTGDIPNISTRSKDIAEDAAAIVAKIMGFKSVDLDTISNEGCSSCNNGSLFDNQYQTQKPDYVNNTTIDNSDPYYKTDIGLSISQVLELTNTDTDDLILNDYSDKTTHPTAYHNGKNQFTAW